MVGDLGTTADDYGAFVRRLDLGRNGPRAAIKDSLDIQGVPTQAGSRAYANAPVPTRNARVVQALLDAGWHIVGKTHMHELAYGVTGINAWAGTPRNPRWPERVPGGSSSGSAVAVAAGLVDVAIGTDTGGSIRVPATCCGVIGLKPTFGRISREGVHPRVSSLDCVGPFARELEQIDAAMSILDPAYRALPTPDALRIGYLSTEAEPWVDAAVRAHVLRCEQHVEPVELRSFGDAFTAGITVIAGENWSSYGHLTDTDTLGADVRARLLAAREVTPQAVTDAEQVRRRFSAEIDAVLEQVDVIALPTLADYPMTLTEAADAKRSLRLTALVRQFNLSGHPALTLPLVGSAGLPVGLQLVGRRGGDPALCAAARLLL